MRIRLSNTTISEVTFIDFTEHYKPGRDHELSLFVVESTETDGNYIADVNVKKFSSFQDAKNYCVSVIDQIMVNGYYDFRKDIDSELLIVW